MVKEENARIYGGIKTKDMPELLENRSINTIEKLIKELTRQGLIVRRGSKKSGGYHTLKDI